MITKIVAVRDRAVIAFGQPFFVRAIGEAMRSFEDEVNRDGSPFKDHPDDYDLYHVGDFDSDSGRVVPCEPLMLMTGKQCVRNKE